MLEVMCLECFNQSEHNSGLFISEVGNEILWFYLLTRREKFREIEA